ncbi:unnamed protein product [Pieris brassicae]|uniref:Uncharacterized protein n=1 Tax=Pieris brassicae TaxID=7116 RepID=A0A9P0X9I5_PIEBR|nr:unnamed protein product [Pieris brassicae]
MIPTLPPAQRCGRRFIWAWLLNLIQSYPAAYFFSQLVKIVKKQSGLPRLMAWRQVAPVILLPVIDIQLIIIVCE